MTLDEARAAAVAATEKAERYSEFKPWSFMVQRMLNEDARAALVIYATAIVVERADV